MFRLCVWLAGAALALAAATLPRPLPDIDIPTPGGKRIRVQQYKGKVMAVLLFSTQCKDCIASVELLNKAQKAYGPRGFQALAAAVNVDAPEEIRGFVDRYRPLYPVGHLGQPDLIKFADIKKEDRPYVPIFIFVDKHAQIRYQYFGNDAVMSQQEKATMAIIDSLLKAN
jgi:peroxiredoxin